MNSDKQAALNREAIASDGSILVAGTSLAQLLQPEPSIATCDGQVIQGLLSLPEYQRPYRWSPKQLAPLLRDLREYFGQRPGTGQPAQTCDFYLGSIILHQRRDEASGAWLLDVIDGQQRLVTMMLIAILLDPTTRLPAIKFQAPQSQLQLVENRRWLATQEQDQPLPPMKLGRISVSLVVTFSQDDAYRFFETQNAKGVRLLGSQIIKAHHLRAVPFAQRDGFARKWEAMGELEALVGALMKARHWQALRWRELASEREPIKVREDIVEELATRTANNARDIDVAYRQVVFERGGGGWSLHEAQDGYDIRQPLNAGCNAIEFLLYFHGLRRRLLHRPVSPGLRAFQEVYQALVIGAAGSSHLRRLFDCAVLLHASRFGTAGLAEVALWIFRAVYSRRMSNQRAVRESTVRNFVRAYPVLDWIASSYRPHEVVEYFQRFEYQVDPSNLESNTLKSRFARCVIDYLGVEFPDGSNWKSEFDPALVKAIRLRVQQWQANGSLS